MFRRLRTTSSRRTTTSVRPPSNPARRVDIRTSVDIALLKTHWKRIRKEMVAPRLNRFYLAADPFDCLPFDWDLDQAITELSVAVLAGTYQPQRPEIVRGAKSLGLTRPLAFLRPEDQLLYRNIVAHADTGLMQAMATWTRFGRADARKPEDESDPESGWFRAWLTRIGQLWTITQSYEWLVETDISNFFPSVQLDAAATHVLVHSRLGNDVVRLLAYMLRSFAPIPEYRVDAVVGLPQESFDCSRIIAHSFLKPVDDEFALEGSANRYSRYMDDIVLGAHTREEGYSFVARAQRSLERIGLYPNASKTRLIHRNDFTREMMKDENDYLGDLDQARNAGRPVDTVMFRQRLRAHIQLRERPRAWERVLRRYYTHARILREPLLLQYASRHIEMLPGSTRNILDYVTTFRLTRNRVERLKEAVTRVGDLYEDVVLLALHSLAVAPGQNAASMCNAATSWAQRVCEQHVHTNKRIAAAAVVVMAKFGGPQQYASFDDLMHLHLERNGDVLRLQLVLVMLGIGLLDIEDALMVGVESREGRRVAAFLSGIDSGDSKAIGLAIGGMQPRERRDPLMFIVPPRAMFLAPLLDRAGSTQLLAARRGWRRTLARSQGERDRVGERWLGI